MKISTSDGSKIKVNHPPIPTPSVKVDLPPPKLIIGKKKQK